MHNLADHPKTLPELRESGIDEIEQLDHQLEKKFASKFLIQNYLTRSLVSFQANKNRANYRWYKYKEGFSASLVEYLFQQYKIANGIILDPFAGSGTALFVASAAGIKAVGIELLPIGQQIINTRKLLDLDFKDDDLAALKRWSAVRPWEKTEIKCSLLELPLIPNPG